MTVDIEALREKEGLHAWVWFCGDEVCDCSRAVIDRRDHRGRFLCTIWRGTLVTDSWEHSPSLAEAELTRTMDAMRQACPALHAAIRWHLRESP